MYFDRGRMQPSMGGDAVSGGGASMGRGRNPNAGRGGWNPGGGQQAMDDQPMRSGGMGMSGMYGRFKQNASGMQGGGGPSPNPTADRAKPRLAGDMSGVTNSGPIGTPTPAGPYRTQDGRDQRNAGGGGFPGVGPAAGSDLRAAVESGIAQAGNPLDVLNQQIAARRGFVPANQATDRVDPYADPAAVAGGGSDVGRLAQYQYMRRAMEDRANQENLQRLRQMAIMRRQMPADMYYPG